MELFGKLIVAIVELTLKQDWERLKARLAHEYNHYLSTSDYVPSIILQRLLISGEDHRYFWHSGVDFVAILRAIWRRITRGVLEGASTIEMQTVRILTGRYERTLGRKIKEILLATLITQVIPKTDIPAVYLRIAYFGWRMNGLKQACNRFGLHPGSMSLEESATLIARLKYPEPRVAPEHRINQILRRRNHLIKLYWKHLERGYYIPLERRVIHATVRGFQLGTGAERYLPESR